MKNSQPIIAEQRASAIIQVLYADAPPPMQFELRDSIAAEIREAVELERAECADLADHFGNELKRFLCPDGYFRESIAATIRARKS